GYSKSTLNSPALMLFPPFEFKLIDDVAAPFRYVNANEDGETPETLNSALVMNSVPGSQFVIVSSTSPVLTVWKSRVAQGVLADGVEPLTPVLRFRVTSAFAVPQAVAADVKNVATPTSTDCFMLMFWS